MQGSFNHHVGTILLDPHLSALLREVGRAGAVTESSDSSLEQGFSPLEIGSIARNKAIKFFFRNSIYNKHQISLISQYIVN